MLTPLQSPYIPAFLGSSLVTLIVSVFNLALAVAVIGWAWFGRTDGRAYDLAVASLVGMLVGGTFFVVLVFYGAHSYIPVPPRYGLSLLPASVAVLAIAGSSRRWGGLVLLALGSTSLTVVLTALI
jgi:hypothetical protein